MPSSGPRSRKFTDSDPIVVGLVNNMPDAALQRTEQQFRELLAAVNCGVAVTWRLFSVPQVPRGEAGRLYLAQSYDDIEALWTTRIDGLIVTGNEPRTPVLTDEPYWPMLAKLVDWAEGHTISTIWSCLAAHAAVLHLDGIARRPLPEKLSGIFECSKAENHAILEHAPSRWGVPHSRHNELPEEALTAQGYCIVSRSPKAGADMFVKHRRSLFIFLQGHPEYDAAALLREYRRDSGRFLAGERDSYPQIPCGYFDEETTSALTAYQEQVLCQPRALALSFPQIDKGSLTHSWRGLAIQLYVNWLSYLVKQRSRNHCPAPALSGQMQSPAEPPTSAHGLRL